VVAAVYEQSKNGGSPRGQLYLVSPPPKLARCGIETEPVERKQSLVPTGWRLSPRTLPELGHDLPIRTPEGGRAQAGNRRNGKKIMQGFYRKALPAIVMALLSPPTFAEDVYGSVAPLAGNLGPVIEGEAVAINGDTITIRLQHIRLHGIQTLEHAPLCGGGATDGGRATQFLSELIAGQIVTCLVQGQDRDQRPAAICLVGTTDLNEAMVLNGFALADTFSGQAYRRTEQTAKALGAGYHESGRRCLPSWRLTSEYPS
jgi:endonuclease YncB( thermonuclease family)